VRALDRPGFAPELADDDRRLLRRALTDGVGALTPTSAAGPIIHGSPHRMNIVVVNGSPRFIDFETVRRGCHEWDLAHLELAVADHYRGAVDIEVLERCRRLVSAMTATWCWDGLTRGPDMRHHAEHHLETVRAVLR
jgi:tRNA A-37 threonylcarbamoyl transferase component Bud32